MEGDKLPLRREFAGADPSLIDKHQLQAVTRELRRFHSAANFFVAYQLDCLEQLDSNALDTQRLAALMVRLNRNLIMAADQLGPNESVSRLGLPMETVVDLVQWSNRLIGRGDVYADDDEIYRSFPQLIRLLGVALERHEPFKQAELAPLVAGQLVAANAKLLCDGDRSVVTRQADLEHYAVNLIQAHLLLEA